MSCNIETVEGNEAINQAMQIVERYYDDPDCRIFQIFGFPGIGKRHAINTFFQSRGVEPAWHEWLNIDSAVIIEDEITRDPSGIHIWYDVMRKDIEKKPIKSFISIVASGQFRFAGKLILVANDHEFPDFRFPEFAGVHINPVLKDLLGMLKYRMADKQYPSELIDSELKGVIRFFEDQ
jgi:hypothetical protein